MELKIALVVLIVLALIVAFVILLSGCTAQGNSGQQGTVQGGQPGFPSPQIGNGSGNETAPPSGMANGQAPASGQYGGFNRSRLMVGNLSNLTDAQRQQLFASRMQQMQGACLGKSQGDACFLQGQGGQINGTCSSNNGTLFCSLGGMRNRASYGN